VLQLSRFGDDQFEFLATQEDLGAVAAAIGRGLGSRGTNWGQTSANKQGTSAHGRFGFAMFQGGEFPAMFLWVTVSKDAVWLWTWLGPDPVAEEVRQALQIVLEARQRTKT
jgi:hypothetical protein